MSDGSNEIEELKAALEALSAKNRELLGEVKAAKAKAKGAEIDPSEHEGLKTQLEELRIQLEKQTKDSAKTIEALNKSLNEKDSSLQNYLVDNGLAEAMVKVGVRPEMMPAVKAMLKTQTKITAADGNYQALIGEKPLADAIAEWASSDEGKHFVAAPANTGGGATGGNGIGGQTAPKGNLGGDKTQRVNAIKNRFPELNAQQ